MAELAKATLEGTITREILIDTFCCKSIVSVESDYALHFQSGMTRRQK